MDEVSSFFLGGVDQKHLLLGNVGQIHNIESFEDMKACVCYNEFTSPSKIEVLIQMHPEGTKNF